MRRPQRVPGKRVGAVLLEALVAIAIVGLVGVAALAMVAESTRLVRETRDLEGTYRDANAFFESVALWTRTDLDNRLGERPQGRWYLRIDRLATELYSVSLVDSSRREVLLQTSLYRALPTPGSP